ncbi:MAG: cytochrome C [Anaerolineaceae bacterium 4572_78]|nr:MAG: cytochrome C [Anaerolineaceae bacterium 4572_78]
MILIAPVVYFVPQGEAKIDNPWQYMPKRLPKTNHVDLLDGPFEDGPSVTKACVECHEEVTEQILHTAHWKWESDPVQVEGRSQPIALGKKNALNNFCIGIQSNWPPCTACHAGYGWVDETFDFSNPANIDCLVCHDNSGMYAKANGGYPADGVDLVSVAQSVGGTTRQNCGTCHFLGGGGNAVKHGDLDETLYHPSERIDVHMGKHDFVCTDCHQTEKHVIKGRSISVSLDDKNQIYCTDCHADSLHDDQRINNHMQKVACQSCHIPVVAIKNATKTHWDWSTAGQDIPEDVHEYLKIKGSFKYEKGLVPEYYWYSGTAAHYLLGDKIDPSKTILMNEPHGDINDPNAKIWPFKVHRAKQIYDVKNNYLLQPKTFGEGGFWTEFDWDKSAMLGSEVVDLDYSGQYDFIDTEMFWPITHMVASKDKVLQCVDCHGKNGNRMDWLALGYEGDPLHYGSR